jgi:hypothetical protein
MLVHYAINTHRNPAMKQRPLNMTKDVIALNVAHTRDRFATMSDMIIDAIALQRKIIEHGDPEENTCEMMEMVIMRLIDNAQCELTSSMNSVVRQCEQIRVDYKDQQEV